MRTTELGSVAGGVGARGGGSAEVRVRVGVRVRVRVRVGVRVGGEGVALPRPWTVAGGWEAVVAAAAAT